MHALGPAWKALESCTPTTIGRIATARHYDAMTEFLEQLLDEIGDDEQHALVGLLDVVAALVHDYEERRVPMPNASPADVLRFLMKEQGLRQTDLAEIFGAQSNVSEVLSGKRNINARQARALAERFGVSIEAFV